MKKVNVGVVGLGMGRAHLRGYQSAHEKIVALCDINQDRLDTAQREFNVPDVFEDFDEMLAMKELDAVSIALPNRLHEPFTVKALRAGKHVLCEKPMAMSAKEARRMTRAMEQTGRLLMIHFNNRFRPQARALKSFIQRGDLGVIYYVRTVWNRRLGVPRPGTWFTQKGQSGGGPLIDLGVHRLDLALWLLGSPNVVTVSGTLHDTLMRDYCKRIGAKADVTDFAAAFVRTDTNAVIALEASWVSFTKKREDNYTLVLGSKGGAVDGNMGDGYDFGLTLFQDVDGHRTETIVTDFPATENPQQHFVNCILKGEHPMASAYDGLTVMKVLDAIYKSAQLGREVKVKSN